MPGSDMSAGCLQVQQLLFPGAPNAKGKDQLPLERTFKVCLVISALSEATHLRLRTFMSWGRGSLPHTLPRQHVQACLHVCSSRPAMHRRHRMRG